MLGSTISDASKKKKLRVTATSLKNLGNSSDLEVCPRQRIVFTNQISGIKNHNRALSSRHRYRDTKPAMISAYHTSTGLDVSLILTKLVDDLFPLTLADTSTLVCRDGPQHLDEIVDDVVIAATTKASWGACLDTGRPWRSRREAGAKWRNPPAPHLPEPAAHPRSCAGRPGHCARR